MRASPASPPASGSLSQSFCSGLRLTWPGRRWRETDALASVEEGFVGPLEVVEELGEKPKIRLIHADALACARTLAAEGLRGKVDLVYVDPPYASDRDYV